jgi:hypothetical protein
MSRADGVHALVPGDVGATGMVLAAWQGKPLLVRHCGNWAGARTVPERFTHWFMERFAGGSNVMLATGAGEQPPSAINPALHWIFSSSLRAAELSRNAASGGKALGATIRLIMASRQEPAKGTQVIIEALPHILQRHANVQLDVVGDGSHLDALKAQTRALGLEQHVLFHGKVDQLQVIRLLQQADLFCFPTSSSEGFPKGVLEALSCGLPVVTTRVSVLPRLISQGCGVLLERPTAEALANAVSSLLSDPVRYRQMSTQAIRVAASFSLENWRDTIGQWVHEAWQVELTKSGSTREETAANRAELPSSLAAGLTSLKTRSDAAAESVS